MMFSYSSLTIKKSLGCLRFFSRSIAMFVFDAYFLHACLAFFRLWRAQAYLIIMTLLRSGILHFFFDCDNHVGEVFDRAKTALWRTLRHPEFTFTSSSFFDVNDNDYTVVMNVAGKKDSHSSVHRPKRTHVYPRYFLTNHYVSCTIRTASETKIPRRRPCVYRFYVESTSTRYNRSDIGWTPDTPRPVFDSFASGSFQLWVLKRSPDTSRRRTQVSQKQVDSLCQIATPPNPHFT